jgi:hypothetical protein
MANINQEDKGELQCMDCGGSPSSEPIGFDNDPIHVALCQSCKDWADFMYEKDAKEEEEACCAK